MQISRRPGRATRGPFAGSTRRAFRSSPNQPSWRARSTHSRSNSSGRVDSDSTPASSIERSVASRARCRPRSTAATRCRTPTTQTATWITSWPAHRSPAPTHRFRSTIRCTRRSLPTRSGPRSTICWHARLRMCWCLLPTRYQTRQQKRPCWPGLAPFRRLTSLPGHPPPWRPPN